MKFLFSLLILIFSLMLTGCPSDGGGGGNADNTGGNTPTQALPTNLNYSTPSLITVVGKEITPNVPKNTGGKIKQYVVQPPLPRGLQLDPVTGIITGTPVSVNAHTIYTITGSNDAGSTSVTLEITIVSDKSWVQSGSMLQPRSEHTITLLSDGKAMAIGGVTADSTRSLTLASTEIYDPNTDTWRATAPMSTPRVAATATLLSDGRVLVTGGTDSPSAEIYNPNTDTWSHAASMTGSPRSYHKATLLADGKVLISGGADRLFNILPSAEIYDPVQDKWLLVPDMSTARAGHTITLLSNNQVLVSGGLTTGTVSTASAEIFDPSTNAWKNVSPMKQARQVATATLLPDGRVLVSGGRKNSVGGSFVVLSSTEIYDAVSNTWADAMPMNNARMAASDGLLLNGSVIVAGGEDTTGTNPLASAEAYDPQTNTWQSLPDMNVARKSQAAVLLKDGNMLMTGGVGSNNISLASTEKFVIIR